MQQVEKELRLKQLRLIVMVTTLIFAFMLVYTVYWLVDYNKEYGFFEKAKATVIEHQLIDGKEYDLLSYEVDGNEFRITTEYESKNDVGDKVTIFYDEDYPLGVIYSLDSRRIVLPILLTVFGVANFSLVVLYFLIKKGIIDNKTSIISNKNNNIIKDNDPIVTNRKQSVKASKSKTNINKDSYVKESNKISTKSKK